MQPLRPLIKSSLFGVLFMLRNRRYSNRSRATLLFAFWGQADRCALSGEKFLYSDSMAAATGRDNGQHSSCCYFRESRPVARLFLKKKTCLHLTNVCVAYSEHMYFTWPHTFFKYTNSIFIYFNNSFYEIYLKTNYQTVVLLGMKI